MFKKAIVYGDRHTGLECKASDRILKNYIRDNKGRIGYVIDLGDGIDNPFMSVYPVDPSYKNTAQDEFDAYASHWKDIHKLVPRAKKILMAGNHDKTRLNNSKKINRGIASLRNLEYESILKESLTKKKVPLDNMVFADKEYKINFTKDYQALFAHGDPKLNPNIKGGVTGPRRTAETYPFKGNIFLAHKHYYIQYPRQYDGSNLYHIDMMADIEDIKKAYMNYHPNSNGFMVINYNKRKNLAFAERIHINKGKALINGVVYK